MSILVVDKDESKIVEISDILTKSKIKTVATSSVKHAIRILEQNHSIDLVVLGYQSFISPGKNLVSFIRQSQRLQWIPVLLICEHCSQDIVENVRQYSISGIMAYPLDPEVVMEKVMHCMSHGKRNILLVDDEIEIVEILQRMLEIERFNVFTANSAEEGFTILKKQNIHAIVSDIVMPQMSGVEFLMRVKRDQPSIPFILITGYSGKYKMEDIMASGADGYFRKPFKNIELVNNLRGIIQTHSRSSTKSLDPVTKP